MKFLAILVLLSVTIIALGANPTALYAQEEITPEVNSPVEENISAEENGEPEAQETPPADPTSEATLESTADITVEPTAETTPDPTIEVTIEPTSEETPPATQPSQPPVFNVGELEYDILPAQTVDIPLTVSDEAGIVRVVAETNNTLGAVNITTANPTETSPPFNTSITVTYLAPADFVGTDTFTLTAIDSAGETASVSLQINVLPLEVTAEITPEATEIPDDGIQAPMTFTVNTTGDAVDAAIGDFICDTDTNTAGNQCSLRAAIQEANANAGKDTIAFSIGTGAQTIEPSTELPEITDPVIIDGTTQPGYSSTPLITLDGSSISVNDGLVITAGNSTVRGLSLNKFLDGIRLENTGGNVIEGNYFGIKLNGLESEGGGTAIHILNSPDNLIGGTTTAARNLISGNNLGILIEGNLSTGNRIQGNYIGTNAAGDERVDNVDGGILIQDSPDNFIGGANPGEGNLISGNSNAGIVINFEDSQNNRIEGNIIGLDATGTFSVRNYNGIMIIHSSRNIIINNKIGGNFNVGIVANNDSVIRTTISQNVMFDNGGLAIDFLDDGPTSNDTDDTDSGPNNLQNFPDITNIVHTPTSLQIEGTLDSAPGTYTLEFFANDTCDETGYGEGQIYLGSYSATISAASETFNTTLNVSVDAGQLITATATDADGSTSEFSFCFQAGESTNLTVNTTEDVDDGVCNFVHCSLREAINASNASTGVVNTISIKIPVSDDLLDSQHIITPTSALPTITDPVIMDGTTQRGYVNEPLVYLDGTNAGTNAVGLNITAGGSTVRGFAIINFSGYAISLNGAGGNTIAGNYINSNGLTSYSTWRGVYISTPNNLIGGSTASERNIFGGRSASSSAANIHINGSSASANRIQGNYIGIAASGDRHNSESISLGSGIVIDNASNNTIGGTTSGQGNVIAYREFGVYIRNAGATGNKVQGNYLGLDASGEDVNQSYPSFQNNYGVRVENASQNTIGGTEVGARNIISDFTYGIAVNGSTSVNTQIINNYLGTNAAGTTGVGILTAILLESNSNTVSRNVIASGYDALYITSSNNKVEGNFIGTDATGTIDLGNVNGITITRPNNTIGGTTPDKRNIISNSYNYGIFLSGVNAYNTLIQGNYIGLDASGTIGMGNGIAGIHITSSSNTIGGTVAGAGNVISGNGALANKSNAANTPAGISITTSQGNNKIQGNLIGTNAAGTQVITNVGSGIFTYSGYDITIGGTTAAARNVIVGSGANSAGIRLGHDTTYTYIRGNYIGLNPAGTAALGALQIGVSIQDRASTNFVGGIINGYGNVISGNGIGVSIRGNNNTVQANKIGTDAAGTTAISNLNAGIDIFGIDTVNSSLNVIGGTAAGMGNIIAHNGTANNGAGVVIANTGNISAVGNQIHGNSIFGNAGLGIDLAPAGVTVNDINDADAGPNNLQNFPLLTVANTNGTSITVEGVLKSNTGSATYRLEFFANETCDNSGYGEGQTYLGTASVTTANGQVFFETTLNAAVSAGKFITATATTSNGNNSEFSPCIQAKTPQPPPSPVRVADCGSGNMTIAFTGFRTFGVVEFSVINSTANYVLLNDFNLGWVQRNPGTLYLKQVVVNGTDIADPMGSKIWQADGNGLDNAPPTTGRSEGTWLANYYFPPNTTTTLFLDFDGTSTDLATAFRAKSADYHASTFTFACARPPSLAPVPQTPANSALISLNVYNFSWTALADADRYQLQIDNQSNFSSPEYDGIMTSPSQVVNNLTEGRSYWRVRGINPAGFGRWSSVFNFTVDSVAPNKPQLRAPLNNGTINTNLATFRWLASPTANLYRIQISRNPAFSGSPWHSAEVAVPSYRLPLPEQGMYYWRVQARDAAGNWSSFSDSWALTFNIQRLPLASAFTTDTTPTFTWGLFTGAAGYKLEVAQDSNFTTPVAPFPYFTPTGSVTSFTLPATQPLDYGVYYWRVSVDTGSGFVTSPFVQTFTLTPRPAASPVLTGPVTNTLFVNTSAPVFTWNSVPYQTALTYEIVVDNNLNFSSPEFTTLTELLTAIYADGFDDGRYYWKVRAINTLNIPGAWSRVYNFTVDAQPPSPPSLLLPANDSSTTLTKPVLDWNGVAGASWYSVQISTSSNFSNPLAGTVSTTAYTFPTAFAPGVYYWRVMAVDRYGRVSPWSNTYSFTIVPG